MIDWEFKKEKETPTQSLTEDFWYCLTIGGYIKPEELLSNDNQKKKLMDAIGVVRSFETEIYKRDLLVEI